MHQACPFDGDLVSNLSVASLRWTQEEHRNKDVSDNIQDPKFKHNSYRNLGIPA